MGTRRPKTGGDHVTFEQTAGLRRDVGQPRGVESDGRKNRARLGFAQVFTVRCRACGCWRARGDSRLGLGAGLPVRHIHLHICRGGEWELGAAEVGEEEGTRVGSVRLLLRGPGGELRDAQVGEGTGLPPGQIELRRCCGGDGPPRD